MIEILLRHIVYEACIKAFFESLTKNFNRPVIETEKPDTLTIDFGTSSADFTVTGGSGIIYWNSSNWTFSNTQLTTDADFYLEGSNAISHKINYNAETGNISHD